MIIPLGAKVKRERRGIWRKVKNLVFARPEDRAGTSLGYPARLVNRSQLNKST
jgi:hypothetical protein